MGVQRPEAGGGRRDVRGSWWEARGHTRNAIGGWREVGCGRPEAGGRRLKVGGSSLEARGQRLEVHGSRSEVRVPKSEAGERMVAGEGRPQCCNH